LPATSTQPDTSVAPAPAGSPARLSVRTLRRLLRDAGRLSARLTRALRRSKKKAPARDADGAQPAPPPDAPAGFAAHFSADDPQERDGWVRRWAPLAFQAGTYDLPKIGPYTVTPAHIKAAVEAQPPEGYPIGDEHHLGPSAVRRRAGGCFGRARLVPSPDYRLFGVEAWFPPAVHAVLGPGPVGLSAHWTADKRLRQIDLTDSPRLDSAGLAALFSKGDDVSTLATPPPAAPAAAPPAQPDLAARLAEMEKREAEYKARIEASESRQKAADAALAAERDKRLLAEAAAFAREQGAGFGKDAKDLLAEAYFSAASDDREHGEATFSRDGAAARKGGRLDQLKSLWAKARERPGVLDVEKYRHGAEFAHDPGVQPGDEFKAVDAAVDAEVERQRKARPQANGRG
jgi:hypothetical protein